MGLKGLGLLSFTGIMEDGGSAPSSKCLVYPDNVPKINGLTYVTKQRVDNGVSFIDINKYIRISCCRMWYGYIWFDTRMNLTGLCEMEAEWI